MRILIIDDHALVREGVALVLRSLKPDAEIVQADTCQGGIDAARAQSFDLVLLDLQLPDMPGLDLAREIAKRHPGVPMIAVTAQATPASGGGAL